MVLPNLTSSAISSCYCHHFERGYRSPPQIAVLENPVPKEYVQEAAPEEVNHM